jgi:Mrp family chromosome partitioning ATPase
MGRMLQALKQNGARRSQAGDVVITPPAPETVPFIEVGGKQVPIEGSPDVLASAAPFPRVAPHSVEVRPESSIGAVPEPEETGLTVFFRPIVAGPGPARSRFAPELVAFHRPEHALSKQYQNLAGALLAQLPAMRSRVLLFTALHPGAGTTTVLLNLAIALARQGKQRLVVVDANPQQPAVAERLGLPQVPGLAEVLTGAVSLQDVLQETGQANLLALTAGNSRGVRGPLGGEAIRALLRQLRERFDLVLFDAPCWSAQAALLPLALSCEAVYLVSAEAEAHDPETASLLQSMSQQGVPLRGHLMTSR